VLNWHAKAIDPKHQGIFDVVINQLFDLALKFEHDEDFKEDADLEALALFGAHTTLFMGSYWNSFTQVLFILPYDASRSATTFLDYLCNNPRLYFRFKAVILKTGMYLLNPYARVGFYIFLSSVLYTWECVTKMRKAILKTSPNIIHRNEPSFASGISEDD
jgi:hypothetical protein